MNKTVDRILLSLRQMKTLHPNLSIHAILNMIANDQVSMTQPITDDELLRKCQQILKEVDPLQASSTPNYSTHSIRFDAHSYRKSIRNGCLQFCGCCLIAILLHDGYIASVWLFFAGVGLIAFAVYDRFKRKHCGHFIGELLGFIIMLHLGELLAFMVNSHWISDPFR